MDFFANRLKVVKAELVNLCNITVADKFPVLIVVSGGKGHNLLTNAHKVFGLAGKDNRSLLIVAVIKRANSYWVSGRNVLLPFGVKYNAGKFGIQHFEHIGAEFIIKRKKNFTVAVALKAVSPAL